MTVFSELLLLDLWDDWLARSSPEWVPDELCLVETSDLENRIGSRVCLYGNWIRQFLGSSKSSTIIVADILI